MQRLSTALRARLPFWLLLWMLALGVAAGFSGGYIIAQLTDAPAECTDTREVCTDFAIFWETWNLARRRYVDMQAIDPERMTEGAIEGMLATLGDDGHTRFLPADEARRWEESLSGSFEGIGAYIDLRNGQAIIVAPIDGSPAQAAGLRPGDLILAVDGESTAEWTIEELLSRVRGPEGTSVQLRILHQGELQPIELTVQRARIDLPAVSWRMLPAQVALIRLNSFSDDSAAELRAALLEAGDQDAAALILDLRNNPGGYLNEAVKIAGQFLPADTTVLLEQDRSGRREPTRTEGTGVARDIPLVVLINENSASSAEILAAALRDAGRARLIGATTIGTGTVLTTFNLTGGARLLLGTKEWLTPEGESIRGVGVSPDEEILLSEAGSLLSPAEAAQLNAEQILNGEDRQLARAYEFLTDKYK